MTVVYSDRKYEIHRLMNTPGFEVIAEVWKEDGRLVAALFTKGNGNYGTQKLI